MPPGRVLIVAQPRSGRSGKTSGSAAATVVILISSLIVLEGNAEGTGRGGHRVVQPSAVERSHSSYRLNYSKGRRGRGAAVTHGCW